jgi:WD40 repeat protein
MQNRTGDSGDKPVVRTLYDHADAVNDLSFHPNGIVLASCSNDQSIKLFDLSKSGVKRAFRYLQVSFIYLFIGTERKSYFITKGCFTCQFHQFSPFRRLFISRHKRFSSSSL